MRLFSSSLAGFDFVRLNAKAQKEGRTGRKTQHQGWQINVRGELKLTQNCELHAGYGSECALPESQNDQEAKVINYKGKLPAQAISFFPSFLFAVFIRSVQVHSSPELVVVCSGCKELLKVHI